MMHSDDLRRRLERLNRKPLPPAKSAPSQAQPAGQARSSKRSPKPIFFRRDLPARPSPRPQMLPPAGPHVALDDAIAGSDLVRPDGTKLFFVQRNLARVADGMDRLSPALAEAIAAAGPRLARELYRAGVTKTARPEDLIFFDLETTGLSSSPLFLIGTMVWEDGGLVTRQYFARDYSQEGPAVAAFLESAVGRKLLVSFNGKSFDLPFVRARAAVNGLRCELEAAHLDLLHTSRRIWGRQLPDCKLQTLESRICGRQRHGDIPGHLIPDAYHEYVRTENACQMAAVLEHNFLDLVTLADLIVHIHRVG